MDQGYIRTTIKIPVHLHAQFMQRALWEKRSLSDVVLNLRNHDDDKNERLNKFLEAEKKLMPIRKKYAKVVRKLKPVDAVRQMRDERAGRYV